ncbi:adenylate kinase [uncultured Amnibacterium sp.]|uniref:adenylate kinase n=1 Tax=uncultured Amnibacterium sp. TaxID=1631851 RepID=UPI0035CC3C97
MQPVRRIVVAGASGSGKTTLAERIAAVTGSPHAEIDGLYWRAGWTASESFEDDVRALADRDAWVTEFQYRQVLPMLADRAQLLVWLRPSRPVVLWRVVRRTLRRRFRRELLWGVNVERPLWTFFTDRDPPYARPPHRFAARRNRHRGPSSGTRCAASA